MVRIIDKCSIENFTFQPPKNVIVDLHGGRANAAATALSGMMELCEDQTCDPLCAKYLKDKQWAKYKECKQTCMSLNRDAIRECCASQCNIKSKRGRELCLKTCQ